MSSSRQYRLTSRSYRRPMRTPLRTARGEWPIREGWLVRLEALEGGTAGYGEVAPLPEFGSEPKAVAGEFLKMASGELTEHELDQLMADAPPATAFGLWAARQPGVPGNPVRTASLIRLGPDTAKDVEALRKSGLTTFKVKLGTAPVGLEQEWLKALAGALGRDDRLRLDPNQSWDHGGWAGWQDCLAGLADHIEFIEEPFAAESGPGQLLHFASRSPIPLALDESLSRDGIPYWTGKDWPGYWVIKPSLSGSPDKWIATGKLDRSRVVLSSALETGIGLNALLRLAGLFPENVHGLGIQSWFGDDFGLPERDGCLHPLGQLGLERIWKELPGN